MARRVWTTQSKRMTVIGSLLLLGGLAGLTWWLLTRTASDDGAGIANVLALPPAVVGVIIGAYGLQSRPRLDDQGFLEATARKLIGSIVVTETRLRQTLLQDVADARPADTAVEQIRFRGVRDDGGSRHAAMSSIADFYCSLVRGRLVILGDEGAGKTLLSVQLLLDLASRNLGVKAGSKDNFAIPLRLSLSSFTETDYMGNPEKHRAEMDAWIVSILVRDHGVDLKVAQVFVKDGWVIPILDGLDEMDSDADPPTRARALLAALNVMSESATWRVVLTSRVTQYSTIVTGANLDPGDPLQDATVVELRPLTPAQATEWLKHRFPDANDSGGIQRRWRRVVTTLEKYPNGRLARCLASPLHLYLAVTVYKEENSRPGDLCDLNLGKLKKHLFEQLVPAVVSRYPAPYSRLPYTAAAVEDWLTTLALHLNMMASKHRSNVDLHVHELWRTTYRPIRIRYAGAVVTSILVSLPLVVLALFEMPNEQLTRSFVVIASFLMFTSLLIGALLASPSEPSRIDFRAWLTTGDVAMFFAAYASISLFISAFMMRGASFQGKIPNAISFGCCFGFLISVVTFSQVQRRRSYRASSPMRQALAFSVTMIVVFGGSFGTLAAFWNSVGGFPSVGVSIAFDLATGTAVGLIGSPWLKYILTVRSMAKRGLLPRRLLSFLDWANSVGIMRLAGESVQFRNREFQAYFLEKRLISATSAKVAPARTTAGNL